MWKREERETVINNPWIRIYRDTVRTKNGKVIQDYYVIAQFSVAMVLPLTDTNQVVLVREYRYGCQDYVWQLPAGKIDDGETAMEAAKRELLEETGYKAQVYDLLGSWYISSIRMPDKVFSFIARGAWEAQGPMREITEEIMMKVVGLDEAVQMVLGGKIKDAHSCTTILWAERLREKEARNES